MRKFLLLLLCALVCARGATTAEAAATTALSAVKLLPKGAAARIALVEASEGTPAPDRWHILIYDTKEDTGVHEYVVAGGEIVASRSLSQFAESLSAEDVFGDIVKIDSDRAAKLAQQYAEANTVAVATMNFELKKAGVGVAPLWNVTCLDPAGAELGRLVLSATKGTVLSHEGFPIEPAQPERPEKTERTEKTKELEKAREPERPREIEKVKENDRPKEPEKIKEQEKPQVSQIAKAEPEKKQTEPKKVEVRKAESVGRGPAEEISEPPPDDHKHFFHRAGNVLQRFFTGRDSASRQPPPPPQPVVPAGPPPPQ